MVRWRWRSRVRVRVRVRVSVRVRVRVRVGVRLTEAEALCQTIQVLRGDTARGVECSHEVQPWRGLRSA